jgi:sugar phosphate isomerase/epimerase
MIKSAVTISLVPEARGGPFVFWDDLEEGCRKAAELGFDAVEIFPPGPEAIPPKETRAILARYRLEVAAVGSGGGWVKHRLTLTSPDKQVRARAKEFIRGLINAARELDAPVVVGSMQGRWGDGLSRDEALDYLGDSLHELAGYATIRETPALVFEPLNRYETNLVNRLSEARDLLHRHGAPVPLLADLFHMNIEEADPASTIRGIGLGIWHVHFADSNRHAAGFGHTDFQAIAGALRDVGYGGHGLGGYVSAEVLPLPDSDSAARQTIESFRKLFR